MTTISNQAFNDFARYIRPLIFETGIEETPYSIGGGTLFLVASNEGCHVITTRHGYLPDHERPYPICINPSVSSDRNLPLGSCFFVPSLVVDDDTYDFVILNIETEKCKDSELGQTELMNLDKLTSQWKEYADESEFFLLGFPTESTSVDYQECTFQYKPYALMGSYVGQIENQYTHTIQICNNSLLSFDGFSGSPVLSWLPKDENRADIAFCGMAIRGTASSRLIHFVESSVLLEAIKTSMKYRSLDSNNK